MLAVIIVSVVLGFILIFMVKRSTPPIAMEEAYYRRTEAPESEAFEDVHPEVFKQICVELLEAWGLRIQSIASEGRGALDISAVFEHPVLGGTYLVQGLLSPTDQIVDSAPVIGLSDAVHHEQALKGIFITTGYFSQEVDKLLEGAPVELVNRDRLGALMKEYGIAGLEGRLIDQGPGEDDHP